MIIAYDSSTGNVKRFINKLPGFKTVQVHDDMTLTEPFVIVTYTTGIGQVPKTTLDFLERNKAFLRGVAASGNRNWGDLFAGSADKIAQLYKVKIIHKFELFGFKKDVTTFIEGVNSLDLD